TKAGLPPRLLAAFRAALAAQDATGIVNEAGKIPSLSPVLIERTLRACESSSSPELRRVNALLHRWRSDALRSEARAMSLLMIETAKGGQDNPQATAPASVLAQAIEIDLEAIEAEIRDEQPVLAA
ncbi:MAG: hypothetical protein KDJ29_03750, partial [Hyphomicrobiales bacterium]|nr:hypothetical protein [Hyphomicrobiales bacterium]